MKLTLSVIKADVGGYVSHASMHPDLMTKAQETLGKSNSDGLLLDYHFHSRTLKVIKVQRREKELGKEDRMRKVMASLYYKRSGRGWKEDPDPMLAVVLMPFEKGFDGVFMEIKGLVESKGMRCWRADRAYGEGMIVDEIWGSIKRAGVVIVDITKHNPNVFYELGIAHAFEKKVILIRAEGGPKVPFDVSHYRHIQYENALRSTRLWSELGAAIDEKGP